MTKNGKQIILFLRAPEKGQVKTRLSVRFSDEEILRLYEGFVFDTLDAARTVSPISLYGWPPETFEIIKRWTGEQFPVFPQQGNDIGEKMSTAFVEIFQNNCLQALLIGTDIPDISSDLLTQAFQGLDSHDLVIGPAKDGGYYLIGFNHDAFDPDLFSGIEWSTSSVFNETLEMIRQKDLSFYTLPELNDIDTPEDLAELHNRIQAGHITGSRTNKYLTELSAGRTDLFTDTTGERQ